MRYWMGRTLASKSYILCVAEDFRLISKQFAVSPESARQLAEELRFWVALRFQRCDHCFPDLCAL
jgi:hypothetical protein